MHTERAQQVKALFTGSVHLNKGKALSKVTKLKFKTDRGNIIPLFSERK